MGKKGPTKAHTKALTCAVTAERRASPSIDSLALKKCWFLLCSVGCPERGKRLCPCFKHDCAQYEQLVVCRSRRSSSSLRHANLHTHHSAAARSPSRWSSTSPLHIHHHRPIHRYPSITTKYNSNNTAWHNGAFAPSIDAPRSFWMPFAVCLCGQPLTRYVCFILPCFCFTFASHTRTV